MRAIPTSLKSSLRSRTSIATAMLFALTACLSHGIASAQVPSADDIVLSQATALGAFPGGGAESGGVPDGDTMAVNSLGDLIASDSYGDDIVLFAPGSTTPKVLGSVDNPNGVAVDAQNNLYIGFSYNASVVKIPYVNGAYATIGASVANVTPYPAGTPNCTGTDTAECVMSNLTLSGGSGVVSMVFDAKGDLFFATTNQNQGGTNISTIYECTAANLYASGGTPTLVYAEPAAGTAANTSGQLSIGGMALDTAGDLFFTDSAIGSTNNQESFSSNVNELPVSSTGSTGYAAAPTVIYTYTPGTPGNYDAEINGVAVGPNGTVYALLQNTTGIVAFPNSGTGYSSTTMYLVGTTQGKLLAGDAYGNLYEVDDNGNAIQVTLNNLVATPSAVATASTATDITTILNDGNCSPTPVVTFTPGGSSASAFTIATSGMCASDALNSTTNVATFPTTLTFTPPAVGTTTATLAVSDTNSGSLTAALSGTGAGTVATPVFSLAAGTYTGAQPLTITDATVGASIYYTTDGSTPGAGTGTSMLYSAPISVSGDETVNAIAVDSGDTSSAVATAAYVINLSAPAPAPTFSVAAGTYTAPQSVTIYDGVPGAMIYYTTDGSTPGVGTGTSVLYTAPLVVSTSETINAIAVAGGTSPSTVATAAYTINLPASAFQNVVLSQATALGAFPGGGAESGGVPDGDTMAVNSLGDLIASDSYGDDIVLFAPGSTTPKVLGSVDNPNGVAVDAQNNLYIGFSYNASVVKIPYVNGAYATIGASVANVTPYPAGTPNCTGTDTAECVMSNLTLSGGSGVVSMVFDAKGDLFFATTNQNQGGTNISTIYECTAANLYASGGTPTLVYAEPAAGTAANTSGQLSIGGMALDTAGDLFFTDSAIGSTNNQESFSSNVNELPVSSTGSTGYAAAPTVIYTYTPGTPGNYDAEINGVAVGPNGTVYALLQNTTGIVAFPNSGTGYSSTTMYLVGTTQGKLLAGDAYGNLYEVDDNGNAIQVTLNNLVATPSAVATASTATDITTILNDGNCSSSSAVTYTETATSSPFSAATTGTCASDALNSTTNVATFATTLTFTSTIVGTTTDTITATDNLNNTATAAVSGAGTGTVATPAFSVPAGTYTAAQTVSITDATVGASIYYTTDGSTPGAGTGTSMLYTGPLTISSTETINAIAVDAGDTSSAVAIAAYVVNIAGLTATPVFSPSAGTFMTPQAVSITDATTGAMIYYTTDGSTPSASSTLYTAPINVVATTTINAIAIASSSGSSAIASALFTITLPPSAFQNVVMSQSTMYGTLPSSGGAQSGASPAGDSMAVNSLGDVIVGNTYGGDVTLFTPQAVQTILGSPAGNAAGVAVDAQNNLFVAQGYGVTLLKVPYVSGAYVPITASSGITATCTGNDTAECIVSSVTNAGSDIVSMVFDAKGDLFFTTGNSNDGGNNQNSIYECTAACLYAAGGSPAPVLLFTEPQTTNILTLGGIALDASGDIFFTDSLISSTTSQESLSSDLDELPVSSTGSTGYAAAPTVIYTHTPTAPGNYDDEIDGVAVGPNGTVYAIVQNTDGILAFPNSGTGYSSSTVYLVSSQSGKLMTSDVLGNLYITDNNENVYQIAVDNLTAPTSPFQNSVMATNITTFLNDGGCTSTPPTVTFASSGTSASAFSAATTGACTATGIDAVLTGASFATTLTFDPTSVGDNEATITATDSLSNTGTAAASGVGTPAPPAATPTFSVPAGTYTTVQTVAITDTTPNATIYYTTDGSTPAAGMGTSMPYTTPLYVTTTETINAIATATGFSSSPVASALYSVTLPIAATPTFSVKAGTYTTPQTVAITDSSPGVSIYYTIDGSMPGAGTGTSVLYTAPITVGVTETINAIAVPSSPTVSFADSAVASALYTINLPVVATPAFSVAAGTYTTVQTVSLSDTTANATIYYTTDGSTPSTTSTKYTTPILVPVSTTIKAIAVDTNYNNSAVATAAYVINLPPTAFTITAPANPTLTVTGGTGSITLTLTANAAFNGSIAFSCSGFLPVGATCTFSPTSVTLAALATSTTKLTVKVPASTAALHRGSDRRGTNPLLPGTMAAAMLCLLGLRKRRRLQMLLMLLVSAVGLSMFSGCTTTSTSNTTSSQIVVTATGSSLPVDAPKNTASTPVSESVSLVLTVE